MPRSPRSMITPTLAAAPGSLSPRSKLQNIRRRTSAPSVLTDSEIFAPRSLANGGIEETGLASRAVGANGEGSAAGIASGAESKLPGAKPRRGSWPKRRASMPVTSFMHDAAESLLQGLEFNPAWACDDSSTLLTRDTSPHTEESLRWLLAQRRLQKKWGAEMTQKTDIARYNQNEAPTAISSVTTTPNRGSRHRGEEKTPDSPDSVHSPTPSPGGVGGSYVGSPTSSASASPVSMPSSAAAPTSTSVSVSVSPSSSGKRTKTSSSNDNLHVNTKQASMMQGMSHHHHQHQQRHHQHQRQQKQRQKRHHQHHQRHYQPHHLDHHHHQQQQHQQQMFLAQQYQMAAASAAGYYSPQGSQRMAVPLPRPAQNQQHQHHHQQQQHQQWMMQAQIFAAQQYSTQSTSGMPGPYGFGMAGHTGYSMMPGPQMQMAYPYGQGGHQFSQGGGQMPSRNAGGRGGGGFSGARRGSGGGSRGNGNRGGGPRHGGGPHNIGGYHNRGGARQGPGYFPGDPSQSPRRTRGSSGGHRSTKTQSKFAIDIDAIRGGTEKRTTVMVRNIPNRYVRETLLEDISAFNGRFDFFYLPMDLSAHSNVGYAFINFATGDDLIDFYNTFHAQKWPRHKSQKICAVAFGRLQGKDELISQFRERSSKVPMPEHYEPLCFYTDGADRGQAYPVFGAMK